jgi:hypothetical protein
LQSTGHQSVVPFFLISKVQFGLIFDLFLYRLFKICSSILLIEIVDDAIENNMLLYTRSVSVQPVPKIVWRFTFEEILQAMRHGQFVLIIPIITFAEGCCIIETR